jgi:hypothetical protein
VLFAPALVVSGGCYINLVPDSTQLLKNVHTRNETMLTFNTLQQNFHFVVDGSKNEFISGHSI